MVQGERGFGSGLGSSSDESGEKQMPQHPQAMGGVSAGGYIIQVPKDQIFRVPPPENSHRYNLYKRKAERKKKSRRVCFCISCRCVTLTFISIFALLLLVTITAGTLYLIYRPKLPSFQVQSLSFISPEISGVTTAAGNSSSSSNDSSILVLAENTNSKLGLDYKGGGTVDVVFYGLEVGKAEWPSFGLAAGEARGVSAVLEGGFADDMARIRAEGKRVGSVVGAVAIRIPARVNVDSLKVPLTVKGICDVKVATDGKVLNSTCDVHLKFL